MSDKTNDALIERLARVIATGHGARLVYQHPIDGMMSVAAMAGFGKWGDSPERYSAAHWKQYKLAAELVEPLLSRDFRIGPFALRRIDENIIEIMNSGEGGHFNEAELADAVSHFVSERL